MQLRVPGRAARFAFANEQEAAVVVHDLGNKVSFVGLWSKALHSTNMGSIGPFPVQMYFMHSGRNISDRTKAGDYVWGHDPKYYTLPSPQDRGMADFELPIGRPNDLPAAWAECIRKFPQLMQEDQSRTRY
jgi:hypothetical protein